MDTDDIRQEHYNAGDTHEVGKCLEAWGSHLHTYLWTALVYLSRAHKKSNEECLKDLRKARFYIDQEINKREGRSWGETRDKVSAKKGTTRLSFRDVDRRYELEAETRKEDPMRLSSSTQQRVRRVIAQAHNVDPHSVEIISVSEKEGTLMAKTRFRLTSKDGSDPVYTEIPLPPAED